MEEFHFCPKFTLIFGIPEFWSILKPREFELEGVSLLYLKLSVLKELSHFQGELQSEKSPRLSNSKNLDYFRIAGILIWKSFTFVQNLHGELQSENPRGYQIPKFWTIFKSREFQFGGVSTFFRKMKLPIFGLFSN